MTAEVVGAHGMVSAGDSLAAATALQVLQSGGNAIEAAVAASAVQCVVELPWCSLGGDAFLLVATPEDGVVAFNGSGAAPRALQRELIDGPRAPRYGPLSVAVPGIVATWEALTRRYQTRPLGALLTQAIEYAREGFPVYPRFGRAIAKMAAHTSLDTLFAGNGSRTGERFRQPALAETLTEIADGGAQAFYSGAAGKAIVAYLAKRGGVLAPEDLETIRVEPLDPLHMTYRGRQVLTQPPVSLGCILLEELKILEGFEVSRLAPGSAELIDLLVSCKAAAFADAAELGDPAETDNRLAWLLSDEHIAEARASIARAVNQPVLAVGGGSDTTSLVVADAHGNVVTLIQSLFNEFGSREWVPSCGVLLNDRLANLSLDPSRPNGLRGGRRPLHTLNSYMVFDRGEGERAGRPILAGATPGGRGQVQINLQVLVNILDYGMDVQTAVDQARWISGLPYRGDGDRTLYLESAFSHSSAEALRTSGHQVQIGVEEGQQADPFGNCTVIARSPNDESWLGAADSRRDAFAIGW